MPMRPLVRRLRAVTAAKPKQGKSADFLVEKGWAVETPSRASGSFGCALRAALRMTSFRFVLGGVLRMTVFKFALVVLLGMTAFKLALEDALRMTVFIFLSRTSLGMKDFAG